MKKILLCITLAVMAWCSAWAAPVDSTRAKTYAQNFWALQCSHRAPAQFRNVAAEAGFSNIYIFQNQNGNGFVILSGDDLAIPVLGYSDENNFEPSQMPHNLRSWLGHYEKEIASARRLGMPAAEEVSRQWENLEAGRWPVEPSRDAVSPLLSTQWDQDSPYNNLCPNGSPTGCAATAMAQVMKYHNWPTTGTGSHSYTSNYQGYNYGTQSANFGNTTYQWSNMLNTYGYSASSAARTAVATLMYHCGVSIEMGYTPDGSGAYIADYGDHSPCVELALKTYFGYSSSLTSKWKDNYNNTQWSNLVKNELNNNRPLVYSGYDDDENPQSGHAFVCDGYNASGNFHFNWGWSGYGDGYFALNSLTPAPGGIGGGNYDFSYIQHALFGVEPSNGGGGGDETDFNLQMYSAFTINPNPLVQGQSVSVDVNMANIGSGDFNGSARLVLETANATQVQVIQEGSLGQTLSAGYYISLSFSGNVTASAGSYKLALYYKATNESSWHYVSGTEYGYSNPQTVTVTGSTAPNLQMYTNFNISPNPLRQNNSATITVSVYNQGNAAFNGKLKAVLENNGGTQQQLIQQKTVNSFSANSTDIFTFTGNITVPAGSYKLALYYQQNGSSTWSYVGNSYNSSLSNPKNVTVTGSSAVADANGQSSTIRPNPACDWVEISATTPVINQMEIFNMAGEIVLSRQQMESGTQVNLSDLPSGIYFVRITTADGVSQQKLIKQ